MSERYVYWYVVAEVDGEVPKDWSSHTWKKHDTWQGQEYEVLFYDDNKEHVGTALAVYRDAALS